MKSAIQIGVKAFLVSFFTLLAIMIIAGVLTWIVPGGSYSTSVVDGREVIVSGTYSGNDDPGISILKWVASPVLVLAGPDSLILIVIIVFITVVSGSINVLQATGIISRLIRVTVGRFQNRKQILLAILTLLFMSFGAIMGIFEEVVLLVPIAISISLSLGWDVLAGMGFSLLAAGFGFSAAVSNPFSIGVAQKLAGLPLFSGSLYRIVIFVVTYAVVLFFLRGYTSRLERKTSEPGAPGAVPDNAAENGADEGVEEMELPHPQRGYVVFLASLVLILGYIVAGGFLPGLSDYSMPVIALLFLLSSWIAALVSGAGVGKTGSIFIAGAAAVLPGVILILMAASVKFIIVEGGILHSLLNTAEQLIEDSSKYTAVGGIYLLVFIMNIFVGSASAKALLIMPIVTPLADILDFTRQTAVLAYSFGDGFSNLLYPTNAVLLIALGISGVSYGKWFRFVIPVQIIMFLLSLVFLAGAVAMHYGPF